jgi:hypothetical protein
MSSFKSLAAGLTAGIGNGNGNGQGNTAPAAELANLKMERNLLERMLQERDEKISSIQKSIQVQNEHVNTLQAKMEVAERRAKQVEQRHQLQVSSLEKEKSMLKSQLEVMHKEILRINGDPIHQALISTNSNNNSETQTASTTDSGRSEEEDVLAQIMPAGNPFDDLWYNDNNNNNEEDEEAKKENEEKIKLANSAQGLLLQSQLYQAMSSLKQLRQQTRAMKADYDGIVVSLQTDLVQSMDGKARVEAGLLSELSLLDQSKKVMQKSLEDQILQKNARIDRLQDRLNSLDSIGDDADMSYIADEGNVSVESSSSPTGTISSRVQDLRLQLQPRKDVPSTGSLLQEKELVTPVSFSDLFAEAKSVSFVSDATKLLERSKSRAKIILERTASTSSNLPTPIMEEEEEGEDQDQEDNGGDSGGSNVDGGADDDDSSEASSASDAASMASSILLDRESLTLEEEEEVQDQDQVQDQEDNGGANDDDSSEASSASDAASTASSILPGRESLLENPVPMVFGEGLSGTDEDPDLR